MTRATSATAARFQSSPNNLPLSQNQPQQHQQIHRYTSGTRFCSYKNRTQPICFFSPPVLVSILFVLSSPSPFAFALSAPTTGGTTPTSASKSILMNDYNLPLDSLAAVANSYASVNGILVEKRLEDQTSQFACAPISLLPNAYPRTAFVQAQTVAPAFNRLVDRLSRDATFLTNTLGGAVAQADPYTAKLLQLYLEIYCGDTPSAFAISADRLGIHRSDYMLHPTTSADDATSYSIKQVELNTIAASFGALSTRVAALHAHLTQRYADSQPVSDFLQTNKGIVLQQTDGGASLSSADGVPVNPALEQLPAAMREAVDHYRERFLADSAEKPLIVVFVVQEGETNTVDQRLLDYRLYETYGVTVVRQSLTQLHQNASVDPETGALMLQLEAGPSEVALVYFRAGYAPQDYPDGYDGKEWQARARLEQSRATKCPSLGYHLVGTKKVQQQLARPGVLEAVFPDDAQAVEQMRAVFAGLYSLGEDVTAEDLQAVRNVLQGQEGKYVLKPQREGGGYNFYGANMADKLRGLTTTSADDDQLVLDPQLGEFILMERLFPPEQKAILLRSGKVEGSGNSISELGCFGTILCNPDGEVVHNRYAGFLLRTKFSTVDEGGVAAGFATLSSPYLVDNSSTA